VKPARDGGLVVITADDTAATGALLRWDAPGFASRELALRKELQLPPAVRVASVTGSRTDVGHFSDAFDATVSLASGPTLRRAGPAPVQLSPGASPSAEGEPDADVRTLYFIPYADAAETTRAMRAVKAANAAKRTAGPVQLRLDGVDVL
jgi:primosomal protein N' (replication factor Y)